MRPFVYNALPARVVFGHGTISQVANEVSRLGCRRALILSTPQQQSEAERLASHLGDFAAGVFAGAVMHTPVEVTEQAMGLVRDLGSDCTIALGGGSTIGLGKAIALRTDLPQIAIPTTYAGSEATPILGETEGGRKTTQRSLRVLPEVIVYDVDLTLTLPQGLTTTSGMNAMAHAVEALYAEDANPVISLLAEQAIGILAQALRRITQNPQDREARADALYGAWACGTCLGSVGMALHHKLCHVLGGSFGLPHAETYTVVLPHAVAFNAWQHPKRWSAWRMRLGRPKQHKACSSLPATSVRLEAWARSACPRAAWTMRRTWRSPHRMGIRAPSNAKSSELCCKTPTTAGRRSEYVPIQQHQRRRPMYDLNEVTITDAVLAQFAETPDGRMKTLVHALVRHLHGFARETEPTFEEWQIAIDFLTRTGQMCSDVRQEFILLSDVLGVSMLVDAINHRQPEGATETTVLGPFHVVGAPQPPHC